MEARAYQDDVLAKVRAEMARDVTALVLVLPTGGGKTVCAARMILAALQRGSRVLFCAHRRELIVQTYRKLLAIGIPAEAMGIIMGNGRVRLSEDGKATNLSRPSAQIQIASIDTLRGLVKRGKLPPFDICFIDECHRCLSNSYVELKKALPNAFHVGLTATPYRANGKGLAPFYQSIVVGATPSQLIALGYIVDPKAWTVRREDLPNVDDVKTVGGDYDESALAKACNRRVLVGSIVEHWLQRAENRRTVCFAVNVAHSKAIVALFVERGIAAEHLDGETPANKRFAILARLDRGETRLVSNCGVLCEGWDQPNVKCCILARPTRSTGLYLQQAGRILRPWNGVGAVILDHSGNVREHGLPSEDREFSLGDIPRKRLASGDGPSCKTCPQCFALMASSVGSCDCGYEWKAPPKLDGGVEHVEGELVLYSKEEQANRRARYDELCKEQRKRGYKPGWVAFRFKDEFGEFPPKSFPRPTLGREMTQEEQASYYSKLLEIGRQRNIPHADEWAARAVAKRMATEAREVVDLDAPVETKWAV